METEKETEHQHMNGWEALAKIVSDITFCIVFLAVLGMIYLLIK